VESDRDTHPSCGLTKLNPALPGSMPGDVSMVATPEPTPTTRVYNYGPPSAHGSRNHSGCSRNGLTSTVRPRIVSTGKTLLPSHTSASPTDDGNTAARDVLNSSPTRMTFAVPCHLPRYRSMRVLNPPSSHIPRSPNYRTPGPSHEWPLPRPSVNISPLFPSGTECSYTTWTLASTISRRSSAS
jgi:hypothetical protein